MTEQPAGDALLECREAFEKWSEDNGEDYPYGEIHHYDEDMWKCWQASRSAFAAELVRKFKLVGYHNADRCVEIIRQMAGEK